MKTHLRFTRVLTLALAIGAISTAAWAAGPPECGMIGTWYGHVGGGLTFFAVHTAGTSDKKGEMVLNWVTNSYLYGAVRLTDGRGVWEQLGTGQYKYTWYAYGMDADGQKLYSVRVSGLAANSNCDNIGITYTYEIFAPSVVPQNMSGATPVATTYDTDAGATRVPLTVVPPPA